MSEKVYRFLVVILLTLILGVQAFGQINKPKPSEECLAAIKDAVAANDLVGRNLSRIDTSYDQEVYTRADNINQQTFLASEHIFMTLTNIAQAESSALRVQLVCR